MIVLMKLEELPCLQAIVFFQVRSAFSEKGSLLMKLFNCEWMLKEEKEEGREFGEDCIK